MTFPRFRQAAPRAALLFLLIVPGLFAYMASENRMYYEISRIDYRAAAQKWGAPDYWANMQRGKTYCAVGMAPIGILLTGPTMSEFTIFDRTREALCPDDSTILTQDGVQHRKGLGGDLPSHHAHQPEGAAEEPAGGGMGTGASVVKSPELTDTHRGA